MRKSKYLVLSGLYFKFNDNLTEINKVKKLFDTQNILDLLKFDLLESIKEYIFAKMNINFIYFSNNIKTLYYHSFEKNKIKYINLSNCQQINDIKNDVFKNNELIYLNLSNKTLTKIDSNTFSENNIKKIKLHDNIEIIYDFAFQINQIKTLDISNTKVKTISVMAFANNKISTLKLPYDIEYIDDVAFVNNNIKYLDLSNYSKLETIVENAFDGNPLQEIKMKQGVSVLYNTKFEQYIWTNFAIYYNKTGKRAGNYKYEDNQWKWYPL